MTLLANYTVDPVSPEVAAMFDAKLAPLQRPGNGICQLCGSKAWGAVCGTCRGRCPHAVTIPGYVLRSNGTASGSAQCLRCGRMVGGLPRGSRIFDYCLRSHLGTVAPCEHCGSIDGSELHHWAPQAIFDDPDDWPTGWLCRRCHTFWHQSMRAARGVSLPPDQRRIAS